MQNVSPAAVWSTITELLKVCVFWGTVTKQSGRSGSVSCRCDPVDLRPLGEAPAACVQAQAESAGYGIGALLFVGAVGVALGFCSARVRFEPEPATPMVEEPEPPRGGRGRGTSARRLGNLRTLADGVNHLDQ
jgi:hypothetical protein